MVRPDVHYILDRADDYDYDCQSAYEMTVKLFDIAQDIDYYRQISNDLYLK
jgi:hypothetical protein